MGNDEIRSTLHRMLDDWQAATPEQRSAALAAVADPDYALAVGLVGFRSSRLRVRVVRREGGVVWCSTADLLDVGTPLVLDAAQVIPIHEAEAAMRHRDGRVSLT